MAPWDPNAAGSTSQADNQYGVVNRPVTTVHPSAARTGTGATASQASGAGVSLSVLVDITAASGTTPTLTVSVEWSHDGTTFFLGDPQDTFTQVTGAVKRVKTFNVKAPFWRAVYTIGGTTPSFTFAIHAVSVDMD